MNNFKSASPEEVFIQSLRIVLSRLPVGNKLFKCTTRGNFYAPPEDAFLEVSPGDNYMEFPREDE